MQGKGGEMTRTIYRRKCRLCGVEFDSTALWADLCQPHADAKRARRMAWLTKKLGHEPDGMEQLAYIFEEPPGEELIEVFEAQFTSKKAGA